MPSALKALVDVQKSHMQTVADCLAMMENALKLDAVLARLPQFPGLNIGSVGIHYWDKQLLLNVYTDRIPYMAPLLEALELALQIDFDNTADTVGDMTYRKFTAANCPWLRVDANLNTNGPGCRKVLTGYEQVPKYKIECINEVEAPQAIEGPSISMLESSDDDIPF